MWNPMELLSRPLVIHEPSQPSRIVTTRDVIRHDNLGRRIVVAPAGTQVPDHVELSDAERALLAPAPTKTGRRVMRPSGMGFFYEDEVA
jgi:hypothetical protein